MVLTCVILLWICCLYVTDIVIILFCWCCAVGMFDRDQSGQIDLNEFQSLWNYIHQWKGVFDMFDRDRSGAIDANELHNGETKNSMPKENNHFFLRHSVTFSSPSIKFCLSYCHYLNLKLSIRGKMSVIFGCQLQPFALLIGCFAYYIRNFQNLLRYLVFISISSCIISK